MVLKILQANLIFCVVFATLASQTVLVEKLKVSKKLAETSPVFTKPPEEWKNAFEMESEDCATAGDRTECQAFYSTARNRSVLWARYDRGFTRENSYCFQVPGLCDSEIWHFLAARRAFVTCFGRVTIDLAGICNENSKS